MAALAVVDVVDVVEAITSPSARAGRMFEHLHHPHPRPVNLYPIGYIFEGLDTVADDGIAVRWGVQVVRIE